MQGETVESIEEGLSETRENLAHWIQTTPEAKRDVQCCAGDDTCVREHLQVIDKSLEQTAGRHLRGLRNLPRVS